MPREPLLRQLAALELVDGRDPELASKHGTDEDPLCAGDSPCVLPRTDTSQRLEAFYQIAPATGRSQRFHSFCRASHFNLSSNRLDAAVQARVRDQIVRFARGFNVEGSISDAFILSGGGLGGGMPMPSPSTYEMTSHARIEREAAWFANHFIEWVNAGLAAEGP